MGQGRPLPQPSPPATPRCHTGSSTTTSADPTPGSAGIPPSAALQPLRAGQLAGIPATAGFVGKIYLIDALVNGEYTWLAVVIVVSSMISLSYYLRVIAAMWMREAPVSSAAARPAGARPAMAGAAPEADRAGVQLEVTFVAVLFGAATIALGIGPGPLFRLVGGAGRALGGLF